MAIHIFVRGSTISPKIYEKDPQTLALAEIINLVETLNAAHQLTVKLTPSTASMMSGNNRCLVCG